MFSSHALKNLRVNCNKYFNITVDKRSFKNILLHFDRIKQTNFNFLLKLKEYFQEQKNE